MDGTADSPSSLPGSLRAGDKGKTTMEALRAVKRHLSDVIYKQMRRDATAAGTDPRGHSGATAQSSADGMISER
jgi:hypothetical protein